MSHPLDYAPTPRPRRRLWAAGVVLLCLAGAVAGAASTPAERVRDQFRDQFRAWQADWQAARAGQADAAADWAAGTAGLCVPSPGRGYLWCGDGTSGQITFFDPATGLPLVYYGGGCIVLPNEEAYRAGYNAEVRWRTARGGLPANARPELLAPAGDLRRLAAAADWRVAPPARRPPGLPAAGESDHVETATVAGVPDAALARVTDSGGLTQTTLLDTRHARVAAAFHEFRTGLLPGEQRLGNER